jgi:hypothetical protein
MEDGKLMHRARWITLIWPGLTELWLYGGWWGLTIACAFSWLANLAIVCTFLWTAWMGPWSRAGVWLLLIVTWTVATVLSFRQLSRNSLSIAAADLEDLFRRAQREYLHGNWVQAEQLLVRLLENNKEDIGAGLMLAGLLRRTGQLAEARARLRQLSLSDNAADWQSEINREQRFLDEMLHSHQTTQAGNELQQRDEVRNLGDDAANQAA